MFDMMGRVSIEHLFRQVQGQHKALAREGSFVFVLILHGSIDSFIERIPAMGIDERLHDLWLVKQDRVAVDRGACVGLAFLPWSVGR